MDGNFDSQRMSERAWGQSVLQQRTRQKTDEPLRMRCPGYNNEHRQDPSMKATVGVDAAGV